MKLTLSLFTDANFDLPIARRETEIGDVFTAKGREAAWAAMGKLLTDVAEEPLIREAVDAIEASARREEEV